MIQGPRASLAVGLAALALLAGSSDAADPAAGPPPGLSYSGDSLHLVPPPGATVTRYTIHSSTQARVSAGERWVIWAKQWPATVTDIALGAAQTKAGCETLGPGAVCFRPAGFGEQGPGQTRVYRAFALVDGKWSLPSPVLSVTRPAPEP
ncbi:hypothetical protein [uncultured Thiodictyon sp.]|uniref:hypothetical protein n=1 Tax=uncultured Thiodictyon sp. TaxID=1846217 RepID=UPI0025CDCAA5|nr:hypothetical protein [uncultured Thiodictyon sp.]